jgi:hypothetical protein
MKTYNFNGENGILANVNNDKFASVKPIYDNNEQGFYRMDDVKDIDVTDDDTLITYDEIYGGEINEEFIPIVCSRVENVENCEKLIYEWVTEDYAKGDEILQEYATRTDDHYDWKSEVTEFIESSRINMKRMMEDDIHDDEDEYDFQERYKKETIKPEWDEIIKDIKPKAQYYNIEIIESDEILEMI